jgi:predicted ATP-dependent endonuclease of OLD family
LLNWKAKRVQLRFARILFRGRLKVRLESVTLAGFRCFGTDPVNITLAEDVITVVGPNAAGKTALLHALAKLFGISRAQRTVERSDFTSAWPTISTIGSRRSSGLMY